MSATLFQPESGPLTVQYQPDEQTRLIENPPRFTWMAAAAEEDRYVLEISKSAGFEEEHTVSAGPLPYNFYTPDEVLPPGVYYWRYALIGEDGILSEWSRVRSFRVEEGLPETPIPAREERYNVCRAEHSRLWLDPDKLASFRSAVRKDPNAYGWSRFYTHSVQPWLKREPIPEPERYPDNRRVAKLWRKMYMDCQKSLYAIRHLSIAGVVLQDAALIARAKQWLLGLSGWDTEGTTSRDYNDEAAFRVAGALAWGYDWLYDELTEEERVQVRRVLLRRTEQVAHHVIDRSKIHHVPYDSHAVRSLSSVFVPCCIALLGEEPKAREWLDYTIEYYACLYTPWGGEDGGWAEGPLYWTTGMAFVTEAINLLRNYTGIDFYRRPFFRKTGDFPLYCCPPGTVRASFGDQSFLGDPPPLKTGYLMRQFAGVTGNGWYQWYYEQVSRGETVEEADRKYYNYGWWDFCFDEMCYLHDFPSVEAVEPRALPPVQWFKDIGWVAMHRNLYNPEDHVMLLAKSSRYGSISHSHGDQNGFLIHAFGEPLAIESGHYVAFGSTMHLNWRRQTRSTNGILIDGHGQYVGRDKVQNLEATGTIETAYHGGQTGYVRMDATNAYLHQVPYLRKFVREIYFLNGSCFVVADYVDLEQSGTISWRFHTQHEMKLGRQSFRVQGTKADLLGQFVYSSSGEPALSQHDEFTGVDPAEIEGLPRQWHLSADTPKARSHRLVTLLVPIRKGANKYVSHFIDDQDHDVHLYFTDQGVTQRVVVQKAY